MGWGGWWGPKLRGWRGHCQPQDCHQPSVLWWGESENRTLMEILLWFQSSPWDLSFVESSRQVGEQQACQERCHRCFDVVIITLNLYRSRNWNARATAHPNSQANVCESTDNLGKSERERDFIAAKESYTDFEANWARGTEELNFRLFKITSCLYFRGYPSLFTLPCLPLFFLDAYKNTILKSC